MRASAFPSSGADPERVPSGVAAKATPAAPTIAIAMPVHCLVVGASRSHSDERTATMAGCVFTRTTDAAILVYRSEVFHDQKWIASIAPAPTAIATSRLDRARH